jgi:hypothetical protein
MPDSLSHLDAESPATSRPSSSPAHVRREARTAAGRRLARADLDERDTEQCFRRTVGAKLNRQTGRLRVEDETRLTPKTKRKFFRVSQACLKGANSTRWSSSPLGGPASTKYGGSEGPNLRRTRLPTKPDVEKRFFLSPPKSSFILGME